MTTGKCLCGKVEVESSEALNKISSCHCDSCRRWTGGVYMSVYGGKDLKFKGEEHVGRYDSSEWAERGFCKNCGSSLFYKLKKTNAYFLMLGLFGKDISPVFDEQDYIDEKPDWYSFSNETKKVTKAEMEQMLKKFLGQ